jgi:uncharacterized protein (TIGR02996 family)
MMSLRGREDQAFLEAIRESPDDDAVRLVYADWLEEQGDASRAEFIRVQCELAHLSGKEERAELEHREEQLLSANRAAWLGPLHKELPYSHCAFRRGFPEELTVRPKVMVKMAEEFNARVPAGRVTLYGGFGDPAMQALMACPCLGWVAGLTYEHPRLTDDGLEMVANSVNLPHLAELSIGFAKFTTNGIQALAASPHRGALRCLSLHRFVWNEATSPATAAALATPGVRFRLRTLSLQDHELGPAGAVVLAGTENLVEVKELDLLLNGLGDEGVIALARSPHLHGLSSLVLQTNDLTARAVQELAGSPLLDGIRNLNLGVNQIGDKGAQVLAACPRLADLERLSLFKTALTDRGAEELAASPYLSNLIDLEMTGNALTDRGSQALFESLNLQRLERISIGGQIVRDKIISQRRRKQWQNRLGKGARV